jgi:putative peptide zinc metalloprotease protein
MRSEMIRGEQWYWLTCANGKNTLRFNQQAWEVIGRCNGNITLDALWQNAIAQRQDACATQPETIQILQQCFEKNLLDANANVAWENREQQANDKCKQEFQGRFSPTGFRLNCGNPSTVISRLKFLGTLFCSSAGVFIWLLCCAGIFSVLARNSERLALQSNEFLMQPTSWWLMAIVFIPIKLIHELAHGVAAAHYGARANQWGISWMFLFPAPFIDISQANMLGKKSYRVIVSCAGIAAELLIAGLALLLWQQAEPGMIRQLLLATWLTAGLSTIVFNANPLMKMDGYYVLVDTLELPNLSQRSSQFWQALFLRRASTLRPAQGERLWLMLYAPSSWLWRANIFYWAFIWVGSQHRLLAFALALAALVQLIGKPLWQLKTKLDAEAENATQQRNVGRRFALAVITICLCFLLLPLPDRSVQKALWTVDNEFLAKARADGFVPIQFEPNSARLSLEDPSIALQLLRIESRLLALQARRQQALQNDLNLAKQLNDEIETLHSEKKLFQERKDELVVEPSSLALTNPDASLSNVEASLSKPANKQTGTSPVNWINAQNLPGQWIKKGQLLGVSQQKKTAILRLVVNQSLAGRISAQSAQFFWASGNTLLAGTLERQTPMALEKLPNAGLSQARGGNIETDPLDQQHTRPLHPSFGFDLRPKKQQEITHGTVTWVVVDFGYSILAQQLLRGFKETIRTQFAVRTV